MNPQALYASERPPFMRLGRLDRYFQENEIVTIEDGAFDIVTSLILL